MIIDITFDPRIVRFDCQYAAVVPFSPLAMTENRVTKDFSPIHCYDFQDIDLRFANGRKISEDKLLGKKELSKIEKDGKKLPDDKGAKKIIVFCNELHKSQTRYVLYIYSTRGIKYSIAKFLAAILPDLNYLIPKYQDQLENK